MQPVGRDDERGFLGPAVLQADQGPGPCVLVVDDLLVGQQLHSGLAAGAQEDPVQVAAVDDHVREAVTPFQVPQVEPGQLAGVQRVAHHHVLREHAQALRLLQQAVLVEYAGAVGRELDAGTDLAELLGPFEDAYTQPSAGEGERSAEAADAASDDDDVGSGAGGGCCWVHRLFLESNGSSRVGVRARRAGPVRVRRRRCRGRCPVR
jgi:hypothetical protein